MDKTTGLTVGEMLDTLIKGNSVIGDDGHVIDPDILNTPMVNIHVLMKYEPYTIKPKTVSYQEAAVAYFEGKLVCRGNLKFFFFDTVPMLGNDKQAHEVTNKDRNSQWTIIEE